MTTQPTYPLSTSSLTAFLEAYTDAKLVSVSTFLNNDGTAFTGKIYVNPAGVTTMPAGMTSSDILISD